jgi:hypothetical protein
MILYRYLTNSNDWASLETTSVAHAQIERLFHKPAGSAVGCVSTHRTAYGGQITKQAAESGGRRDFTAPR